MRERREGQHCIEPDLIYRYTHSIENLSMASTKKVALCSVIYLVLFFFLCEMFVTYFEEEHRLLQEAEGFNFEITRGSLRSEKGVSNNDATQPKRKPRPTLIAEDDIDYVKGREEHLPHHHHRAPQLPEQPQPHQPQQLQQLQLERVKRNRAEEREEERLGVVETERREREGKEPEIKGDSKGRESKVGKERLLLKENQKQLREGAALTLSEVRGEKAGEEGRRNEEEELLSAKERKNGENPDAWLKKPSTKKKKQTGEGEIVQEEEEERKKREEEQGMELEAQRRQEEEEKVLAKAQEEQKEKGKGKQKRKKIEEETVATRASSSSSAVGKEEGISKTGKKKREGGEEGKREKEAKSKPQGGIVELTSATFNHTVSTGQWLIEFYSPQCSTCQAFAPILDEVAKEFANRKKELPESEVVRVGRVNVDNEERLRSYYLIKTLPTLKFIFKGRMAHLEAKEDTQPASIIHFVDGGWKNVGTRKYVPFVP